MPIINADFLEYSKYIPDEQFDLIITDPPYGVGYKNKFFSDSEDYVLRNMYKWYQEWFRLLKPDGYLVLFVGVKNLDHWLVNAKITGWNFKNIIATRSFNNGAKRAPNNFGFQFQPVILFSKGKGHNFNKVDFIPTSKEWFNDKRNKNPNPYTYEYPNWIKTEWAFGTAKNSSKNNHPNEKNVEFIEFLVKVLSDMGDTVLDSFCGSGSTGVACKNCRREFIGIDINPELCKVSAERTGEILVNPEGIDNESNI